MSGKANIFKTNKTETQSPDLSDDIPVRTNIFKSSAVNEDDCVPEPTVDLPKQNIFKDRSLDVSSSAPADTNINTEPAARDQLQMAKSRPLSKLLFVGAGSLIGLTVGAYVFLSSESTPKPAVPVPPPVSDTQATPPVAPATASNPVIEAPSVSIATFKSYLTSMLQAAHDRNRTSIDQSLNALAGVPRPPAGNQVAARSANEQGLDALKSQSYSSAITAFRLGIKQDPSNVELINNLGFALYKSGQLNPAQEQIELSLLYSPKRASAWVNLGDIYFKEGNESNAIDAYLLAYAFSANKERLYKMVESKAENDPDSYTRIFYTKVLATLRQSSI